MNEKEFVIKWKKKITADSLVNFPDNFLDTDDINEIILPSSELVIGREFFGQTEILTVDGSSVLQVDSYDKAKYIVYSNRCKPMKLKIPRTPERLQNILSRYESYIDILIKQIELDYRKEFPEGKNAHSIINEVFKILNLKRY